METTAAQPQTLRGAIEFIHGNAHRDIGLSDIAAALNVTPRSVQYMFRRHLATTPLEYLRRVRLDRAHRDLQAADPAVDTVMEIAGRWFAHPGRFSMAYKEVRSAVRQAGRCAARNAGEPDLKLGGSLRGLASALEEALTGEEAGLPTLFPEAQQRAPVGRLGRRLWLRAW